MGKNLDELWKGADDIAFLHVYGQYQWHAPATVKGNRLALEALASAISNALASGSGKADVVATDGEGYSIDVYCTELVSAIGTPEYLYALEYKMGEEAARRATAITPTI